MTKRPPSLPWLMRKIAECDRAMAFLSREPEPGRPWHRRIAQQRAYVEALDERRKFERMVEKWYPVAA